MRLADRNNREARISRNALQDSDRRVFICLLF
jgi:hypothetical protein